MKLPVSARATLLTLLLAMLASTSSALFAQQKEMTLEELEQYIAEQRDALDLAKQNRDDTKARVEDAQNAIDEQELRHQDLLDEVDTLCREQEELQPGSFADCMAQFSS